jgi:hypothetical protein
MAFFMAPTAPWPTTYDAGMRVLSWLLISWVLLQWVPSAAMPANPGGHSGHHTLAACHDGLATGPSQAAAPVSTTATWPGFGDCHHCCVPNLPLHLNVLGLAAPPGPPHSTAPRWVSVSLPPDLRPPIG